MENTTIYQNNKVTIRGIIEEEPVFDHEVKGEKFYFLTVKVERLSGTFDFIPVIISERLIAMQLKKGSEIAIVGQFRSHNKEINGKHTLQLVVFVKDFEEIEFANCNEITLEGYICKQPQYRETPHGRKVCDLLLAVNRPFNGKTDYIPLIAWERNANYASMLNIGDLISISGRVQSRPYVKKISETESIERVAYEVSIKNILKVEVVE